MSIHHLGLGGSGSSGGMVPISSSATSSGGQPLFACTRCMSRHPFEELSQGLQLCKECRGAFPIVKCTYCRTEFQQESKSSLSPICKKCEQNVKQFGKPSPCEYCNIIAAFIGSKCQRCTNSEKKYGPPLNCDQCKQRCAFDRDSESRKKVDGKLLCWLCTLSYKRALAKAKQNESSVRHTSIRDSHRSSRNREQGSHSSGRHGASIGHSSSVGDSGSKKPRLDIPLAVKTEFSSNGNLSSMAGSTHSSISDVLSSRPMVTDRSEDFVKVTQLQTEVQRLQKQLKAKDQEMLNKDKIIADLRAKSSRDQHEMRDKLNLMQKKHDDKVQELTQRVMTLQKQNATLSKLSNKSKPITPNASPPPT